MNHASLFSGIGGFDLAAEWMRWNNILQCENDWFCRQVLNYYWPKTYLYEDIKTTDFTVWQGKIDILTGGFPCQPYSQAGKRKGTEDDRHLWPEMLRAVREIRPRWIVAENVYGLVNWNEGLVFEEIQTDLETQGYEVQPLILPASGVNAPHRRERVWFVAYCNQWRLEGATPIRWNSQYVKWKSRLRYTTNPNSTPAKDEIQTRGYESRSKTTSNPGYERQEERQKQTMGANELCKESNASNAESTRSKRKCKQKQRQVQSDRRSFQPISDHWKTFPTQSPVCGGNDGLPTRLDGITFPKWRNESIKAYGNAVVPQVVYEIFKVIGKMEEKQKT